MSNGVSKRLGSPYRFEAISALGEGQESRMNQGQTRGGGGLGAMIGGHSSGSWRMFDEARRQTG
jgi:hypothetical protein